MPSTQFGPLSPYIQAAGIDEDRKGPLFCSARRTGRTLTRNYLTIADVWQMVPRRAKHA
jgi:hypothetical protein